MDFEYFQSALFLKRDRKKSGEVYQRTVEGREPFHLSYLSVFDRRDPTTWLVLEEYVRDRARPAPTLLAPTLQAPHPAQEAPQLERDPSSPEQPAPQLGQTSTLTFASQNVVTASRICLHSSPRSSYNQLDLQELQFYAAKTLSMVEVIHTRLSHTEQKQFE